MGEIAEMMLDGTLCECCGAYIDDGAAPGFPRYCSPQCARDRGVQEAAPSDEDCIAYLNDLRRRDRPQAAMWLRNFMGIGKKRAKRLVAQWRAALATPTEQGGGE
jgi:hypothetical protein